MDNLIQLIVTIIQTLSFGIIGSRRDEKNWYHQIEKKGEDWLLVSLTRSLETYFKEGWSKAQWAQPFTRRQTIISEDGSCYVVMEVPCIFVTFTARTWLSRLGLGEQSNHSETRTIEGVTLERCEETRTKTKNGTTVEETVTHYKIVKAEATILGRKTITDLS